MAGILTIFTFVNIIICDDIKEEASEIEALLKACEPNANIWVFTNPWQVLKHIGSGVSIDVCFLDIMMPETNGIELAEKLRKNHFAGEIIFLTSSNDFASQSYKVKAFNYLLKPADPEKVAKAMSEVKSARQKAEQKFLSVKIYQTTEVIPFNEIVHIEAMAHNLNIYLRDKRKIKAYTTFSSIAEQLLQDKKFIQCHRSYIINASTIASIASKTIVLNNGAEIPISRSFANAKEKIMEWMFEK